MHTTDIIALQPRPLSVNLRIEVIIAMAEPDCDIRTATEVHFRIESCHIITREFEKRQSLLDQ